MQSRPLGRHGGKARRRDQGPKRASTLPEEAWYGEMLALRKIADIDDPETARNQFVTIINKRGFNLKVFLVAASGFFTDSYTLFATNVTLPALTYVYFSQSQTGAPQRSQTTEIAINALTLAGSAIGQALFGYLADRYGRQRLYGIELVIVIFCTLGLASCGPGVAVSGGQTSMSVEGWIMFWRFFMGIGVGAEYPLSASITVEWAAEEYRAKMLAAVFLMQPIGQFCAYGVGLAVLGGLQHFQGYDLQNPDDPRNAIALDILWRIVTGVGGLPALIALIFRWWIPESGRWSCDVKRSVKVAIEDTYDGLRPIKETFGIKSPRPSKTYLPQNGSHAREDAMSDGTAATGFNMQDFTPQAHRVRHHVEVPDPSPEERQSHLPRSRPEDPETGLLHIGQDSPPASASPGNWSGQPPKVSSDVAETANDTNGPVALPVDASNDQFDLELPKYNQFRAAERRRYFITGGNWRILFGACACWFFLDFVFYGLGFNNPGTLAKLWTDSDEHCQNPAGTWLLNSAAINHDCNAPIYTVLKWNGIESLTTVAIWSILGSALMVNRIKFIDRWWTLIWTSFVLTFLLLLTAILFPFLFHKSGHTGLIILYAVIQFFFSYGPNTLVFVVVAEIFPTKYRCFCYGWAAFAGKLGAVLVQVEYIYFDHQNLTAPNSASLGLIMYQFAAFMAIVGLVAWLYIPKLNKAGPRVKADTCIPAHLVESKPLEELGNGRECENDEDKIGFVERSAVLMERVQARFLKRRRR